MDITILIICTALSFIIVFLYALKYTNRIAEKELSDEHTALYQFFSTYLHRQKNRYHLELKKSIPTDRDEDDEDEEEPARISGAYSETMPLYLRRQSSC